MWFRINTGKKIYRMGWYSIKWITISSMLFLTSTLIAREPIKNDSTFARYLYQNQQYQLAEIQYLQLLNQAPSAYHLYKLISCKLKQGNYDISDTLLNYNIEATPTYNDSLAVLANLVNIYQGNIILSAPTTEHEALLHEMLNPGYPSNIPSGTVGMEISKILAEIRMAYYSLNAERKRIMKKKPIYAAALSCFIPGLGKVYAQKPREIVSPLLKIVGATVMSIELYEKHGQNSLLLFTAIGYGIVQYVAGIYGAYFSVKTLQSSYEVYYQNKTNDLADRVINDYIH